VPPPHQQLPCTASVTCQKLQLAACKHSCTGPGMVGVGQVQSTCTRTPPSAAMLRAGHPFPLPGCTRVCTRRSHLLDHLRSSHHADSTPLPGPALLALRCHYCTRCHRLASDLGNHRCAAVPRLSPPACPAISLATAATAPATLPHLPRAAVPLPRPGGCHPPARSKHCACDTRQVRFISSSHASSKA
jgi:hypothetical protein